MPIKGNKKKSKGPTGAKLKRKVGTRMTKVLRQVPVPQKVRWSSGDEENPPGMQCEGEYGVEFIPWDELKPELEKRLLIQLGRVLGDMNYSVITTEFQGRKNWLIQIVNDANNEQVGSIWLGGDPYSDWK